MYSLNDDPQGTRGSHGIDYFKPGVNVRFMNLKGDAKIAFRILPAFDPATVRLNPTTNAYEPTDPRSWVPFRDPRSGQVQTWARKITVAAYVGHGRNQQSRRANILCMETFREHSTGQTYCPVQTLLDYIQSNREWQYLTEDTKGPDGKTVLESKALGFPTVLMLANIVVPTQAPKVELGVFKLSAYKSLFNKEKPPFGLVYQEAVITDPAVLQADPMRRWAAGDITDPNKGFVLEMGRSATQYGEYYIGIYVGQDRLACPYPVGDALLTQRYNLYNIDTLVRRPTDDETIAQLVRVLNGINPGTKEHEWVLLQRVFGSIAGRGVIPPPPAQGYVQGFSMPAAPAPAAAPTPIPAQVPPYVPTSAGAPFPPPAATVTAAAPAPSPFPVAPPVAGPLPGYQPPRTSDTPPFVPSAAVPATAPAQAAAPATAPVPGDQPEAKARADFLAQLQGAFGRQQTNNQ